MSNIIQNGASTTVNLQTGEKLAISAIDGTFSAVIRAGAGVGTALATNSLGGEYGPYVSPVVIQVSSSADGLVDFEVGTVPTLDYREPVTATTNPLTGGINLSASYGASIVGYLPNGSGSVLTNVQSVLDRAVSILDKGANTNPGFTDCYQIFQSAIDSVTSNSEINVPPGIYRLSSRPTVSGKTNIKITGHGAKIICDKDVGFLFITGCDGVDVTGFRIIGSLFTDLYVGNAEQGRIVVQATSNTNIYGNQWKETAGACFIQSGAVNTKFHHNDVIDTHSGIQTSSATYTGLFIRDNYFRGHVFASVMQGADDQIAIFGASATLTIISGNSIDKQGPTAYNQARGISISSGSGSNGQIIVKDNIIKNVVTTTASQCRAAIALERTSASQAELIVSGNVITNCNAPIYSAVYCKSAIISGNHISGAVYLAGSATTSGSAIAGNQGGNDGLMNIYGNIINSFEIHGINFSSTNKLLISSNIVNGSLGATSRGISIDTCHDSIVVGNISYGNYDGFRVNACQRITFAGNSANSNAHYGFHFSGANISGSIAGNTALLNATSPFQNDMSAPSVVVTGNNGIQTFGISGTTTVANNLRGSATFSAATSKVVAFSTAEPDASYFIAIGATSNNTFWITSKTTAGFTINCSASVSDTVDWHLVR